MNPTVALHESAQSTVHEPVVYVIDDNDGCLSWIQAALESGGYRVRGFENAQQFLDAYDEAVPGCMVVDYDLPGMSGLELVALMRERGSTIPFVVSTGVGTVQIAVEAMKQGALTIIEKPFHRLRLLEFVASAIKLDVSNRERCHRRRELEKRIEQLTEREHEILELLIAGKVAVQIAAHLQITPKTVTSHHNRILKKLGAETVLQIVQQLEAN